MFNAFVDLTDFSQTIRKQSLSICKEREREHLLKEKMLKVVNQQLSLQDRH